MTEAAIPKDALIEVSQVANGYIVRAGGPWFELDIHQRAWTGAANGYLVFRTLAELLAFLREHFSHRARAIEADTEA